MKLMTWMSSPAIRRHQRLCPPQDRRLQRPSAHWAAPSAGSSRTWGTQRVVPLDQSGRLIQSLFSPLLVSLFVYWFLFGKSGIMKSCMKPQSVASSPFMRSLVLLSPERGRVGSEWLKQCPSIWAVRTLMCFDVNDGAEVEGNILVVARRMFHKQATEFCLMVPVWLV